MVAFDDETKNAKVSLRQQEILAKLSSIVDDLSADSAEQLAHPFHYRSLISHRFQYFRTHFSSRVWSLYAGIDSCLSIHRIHHGPSICRSQYALPVSLLWRRIYHLIRRASRNLARKHLKPNEIPMSFTSFPRLGVPGQFTEPYYDPADAVSSHSLFLPEEITNPHARFP